MNGPIVVLCVDGLDPSYLGACRAPTLEELGKKGLSKTGLAMVPTVTNVNNVSVVTGRYPREHGIATNYWFDRESGREVYMESGEYLQADTMLERAARKGLRSMLATSKDKLRRLLDRGTTVSFSAEKPLPWLVDELGEPPPIYSLEVNGWMIRAAGLALSRERIDLAYVATTDYAQHTYAPEEPQSQEHMTILDDAISGLLESHPDAKLLITADHGMRSKSRMVDLEAALEKYGVKAQAVPVIKDKYVVHHSNLGGCIYAYLESVQDTTEALNVLRDSQGVEEALTNDEASNRYHLPRERTGDIVVHGGPETVFGKPAEVAMPDGLRSHGSLYERDVPIIGYGADFEASEFMENRDVGRYVFKRLGLDAIE
jgi:phosphonoacetate hydrolase